MTARIADQLGVKFEPLVHAVLDDEHARAIALGVNLHRRHDAELRRAYVVQYAADGMSQVEIADRLDVSRDTVQRDLQGADIGTLPETITRSNGRPYPRQTRPRTAKEYRSARRAEDLARSGGGDGRGGR